MLLAFGTPHVLQPEGRPKSDMRETEVIVNERKLALVVMKPERTHPTAFVFNAGPHVLSNPWDNWLNLPRSGRHVLGRAKD